MRKGVGFDAGLEGIGDQGARLDKLYKAGTRGVSGPVPDAGRTLRDRAGTAHRPNGTSLGGQLVRDDTRPLGYSLS